MYSDTFLIPSLVFVIPVPVTQISFSQCKNRQIPVPILPIQGPLFKMQVISITISKSS